MKKIIILALFASPYICFAQNFKKQTTPKLNLELFGGYPFAGLGTSMDFRSNTSLKVYLFTSINDSSHLGNEWMGMTKTISINKKSNINLGLGMFTQFSKDLMFDIAPSLQYEYDISESVGLSVSYMHVFPDHWTEKNIHVAQIGLIYGIPTRRSNNGIAKYKKYRNRNVLTTLAFWSHYTMGCISFYLDENLGLDLRGYTDLGYLFNVEQSIDMQCISAVYSIDAVKDICFDSYFGLSTTLQSNSKFHSLFLSERMRVRLYENLWFSVELTQHSNAVVKDRIQPILHSGFLLSL